MGLTYNIKPAFHKVIFHLQINNVNARGFCECNKTVDK